MRSLHIIFFAVWVFLLFGCVQHERKQDLEAREKVVELREQQMTSKEKDYQELQMMRDSLQVSSRTILDSTVSISWPEVLKGDWNSKMICRSSGCGNYVIGDQRNELWRFQLDSVGVYVQVINGNKEVRRYRGGYDGRNVILTSVVDTTVSMQYESKTVLDHIGTALVRGNQYLTGAKNCETVFSIELTSR